jgi:hypothetical protein
VREPPPPIPTSLEGDGSGAGRAAAVAVVLKSRSGIQSIPRGIDPARLARPHPKPTSDAVSERKCSLGRREGREEGRRPLGGRRGLLLVCERALLRASARGLVTRLELFEDGEEGAAGTGRMLAAGAEDPAHGAVEASRAMADMGKDRLAR